MALEIITTEQPKPAPCDHCGAPRDGAPVHCNVDLVSANGDIQGSHNGRSFLFTGATGRVRSRVMRAFCSRDCLEQWWLDADSDKHTIAAPADLEDSSSRSLAVQHPNVADADHLMCDCGGDPDDRSDRNLHVVMSTHDVGASLVIHDVTQHACPCALGAWWRSPPDGPLSIPAFDPWAPPQRMIVVSNKAAEPEPSP